MKSQRKISQNTSFYEIAEKILQKHFYEITEKNLQKRFFYKITERNLQEYTSS
jgi:hypothetical protein